MSEPVDAGRRRRFEVLFESYFQPLTGYVRRRLGTVGAEAEDVVAEIFLVAWRRLEAVPAAPADRLWLYGVARRTTAQALRSRRRRGRLADRVTDRAAKEPVAVILPTDDPVHDRVRAVVAGLRSRDREVVELAYWERMSQREIAAFLGCSENAVALRLKRARERMRRKLAVTSPSHANPTRLGVVRGDGASLEAEGIVS